MIHQDAILLDDFSKQFNARIQPDDLADLTENLIGVITKQTPLNIGILKLPCTEKTLKQLIEFGYEQLLQEIIQRIKIEPGCMDLYRSEMAENIMELHRQFLQEMNTAIRVAHNEAQHTFDIILPDILIPLIGRPISQFHMEVSLQLEFYNKHLDLRRSFGMDPPEKNLYVDSKVSTSWSYFILAFIAQNLQIPLSL